MRHRRPLLFLPPLLGALAVAAAVARAAAPAAPGRAPYMPAKSCAACHATIYSRWSEGPHATAALGPAYLEALARAVASGPDAVETRRMCVWCHAPTTLLTGDFELQQPISREGVTCDFCHTVAEVDMDKADHPFRLAPGDVKRGPLEYAKAAGHKTLYSPLHKASPLLCASCHEFRNGAGVAVLSTYSEWKDGPYPARGVPCQECHMPVVPGAIVKESGTRPSLRIVNQHRVVGGSFVSQLNRGLDLKIDSLTRSSGAAEVTVVLTNTAAGHQVPGGLATKTLVLMVGAVNEAGSLLLPQERVYRRELLDAQGKVLTTVADQFLRATAVGKDTRLKPKESRTERFTVPLPADARAVAARLEYRDASDPRSAPKTSVVVETRRELSTR